MSNDPNDGQPTDAELLLDDGDEDEDGLEDESGSPYALDRVKRAGSGDDLLRADGFTLYLAEIRNYPLLSREEELEVATAYFEDGDKAAGRRLVTGNLRLVVKIALEYRRAWV
ncbi:MAG: RNA polymerase subunit sigma-70, partial [Myxococcales bacterium]|nr:RNA polymerase subunit sigma-70 [Myxococcales bacterium]